LQFLCCTGTSLASAVYRDERGTGKSFDRRISRCSMTVEQFIADLDELVEAVGTRVGQNKVAIMSKEARVVAGLAQRAGRTSHAA